MAIVESKENVPLNNPPDFRIGHSMDTLKTKFVQYSKSAVQSKVSKISAGVGACASKHQSHSHAKVPHKALRRRGVYVEKKPAARTSRADVHVSPLIQAYMAHTDRRARAHTHRRSPTPKHRSAFISNALSVLAQPSASTQCDPDSATEGAGNTLKKNASISANDDDATTTGQPPEPTRNKHKRHRKRQPMKTTSDHTNQSNEPPRPKARRKHKKRNATKESKGSLFNEYECRIANAVLEGKEYKTTRRNLVDDNPVALVSTMDRDQLEDKGLYKLFIDLLETSFSVYNMQGSSPSTLRQPTIDLQNGNQYSYSVNDEASGFSPRSRRLPKSAKSRMQPVAKKMAVSPGRYQHAYTRWQTPEKRRAGTKRSLRKNVRDQTLLGLLRHQLHMETDTAPQPNNLYQSLRVMAQSNTRRRRTLRFRDEERRPPAPHADRNTLRRRLFTDTANDLKPILKRNVNQIGNYYRWPLPCVVTPQYSNENVQAPQIEEISSYGTLEVFDYENQSRSASQRHLDSEDTTAWEGNHKLH